MKAQTTGASRAVLFAILAGTTALATIPRAMADDVTARAPQATDDSSRGYSPGNLWNVPGKGEWINTSAARGAAVWTPVKTGILPLDAVPGKVLHAWGTRRLRAGFNGSPITVTVNGTNTALRFDAAGAVNAGIVAATLGLPPTLSETSQPQMWSAAVTAMTDQTSGTPTNLSVPTGSVAPQISPAYLTGGNPYVGFADGGMNWLTDVNGNASNVQHPRLWTPSLTGDAYNTSITAVVRNVSTGSSVNSLATFAGTYPLSLTLSTISGTSTALPGPYGGPAIINGNTTPLGFQVPASASVYGINSSSTSLTAYDDDNGSYSGAQLAYANTPSNGFFVGGLDTVNWGFGMGLSALITGPALTPGESLALREALTDTFRLTPQKRDRIIMAGDSIGSGADGWMAQMPILFAESQIKHPFVIYNTSIPGSEIGGAGSAAANSENNVFSTAVTPLYSPYGTNILYQEGGVNSLGLGNSPEQTMEDWTTWANAALALGPNVKLIGQTLGAHYTVSPDSLRIDFNTLLKANTLTSAIIDSAANSIIGNPTVYEGSRKYSAPPGGHESPYIQSLQGSLIAKAINGLNVQ